jgi:hypothetical protein
MVREAGRRRRKRHIIRFPAKQENLFIMLRLLSPAKPLRWVSPGTPYKATSRQHLTHQSKEKSRLD